MGEVVQEAKLGDTPLDNFRRSAGFQFMFVLHSGLEVGKAIDHLCASAQKFSVALREWQPIETAPLDQSVLIFIPSPVAEHYGPAIYRGLCVENMNHERVWKTSALHSGRDCGANYWPTHWMPLPEPPEVKS